MQELSERIDAIGSAQGRIVRQGAEIAEGRVQSLGRAIALLRLVAACGPEGPRLSELVMASGLPKPTVARLMADLLAAGLVMRSAQRRFQLGPLTYELGLASASNFRLRSLCRPALLALAEATGETVYLKVRSGADVTCLDLATASRQRKARTSWRGSRAPLGTGACGLALLSFLPLPERERVPGHAAMLERIERTRRTGHALSVDDVFAGMSAVGLPVFDAVGQPIVAISVSMPTSALNAGARERALDALHAQEPGLRQLLRRHGVLAADPRTH